MCVRVRYSNTIRRIYDADLGTITLPTWLPAELTQSAVTAVMAELHVPQEGETPVCWCGEPLDLSALIPEQRTGEVVTRGA